MRLIEGLFVALDKSKYPELKRLLVELFQYSEQRTYANHFIPFHSHFVKSKHLSVLTNQHLKELLRNAITKF